jgi:mono/diheme cytochrome c family protein
VTVAAGGTLFAQSFEDTVQPFLARNCHTCHSAKLSTAGLNLEAYENAATVEKNRDRWELIFSKIESGEMPPAGMPRPDPAASKAVTGWLQAEFQREDKLIRPDPGHVTARRLNRAEYDNTVRDLLGIDFHPADDFPQDDSGYGFDNIGDVLSLSPGLMEKYLTAAEKVTRAALYGEEAVKPALVRYQPPLRHRPAPTTFAGYDESGLSLPSSFSGLHRFPVDAEYLFKFTLNGTRPSGSDPATIALWIDGKQIQRFSIENNNLEGQTRQFRTHITKGEHLVSVSFLKEFEGLPPQFKGPNPAKTPPIPSRDAGGGRGGAQNSDFQSANSQARAQTANAPGAATPAATQAAASGGGRAGHGGAAANRVRPVSLAGRVDALDIGGPFDARPEPPTESLRKIFACGHLDGKHNASCPRKILSDFARRAYRRPVTAAEVDSLVRLYTAVRARGDSFNEGIAVPIEYILASPDFLFRIEGGTKSPGRRLSVSPAGQRIVDGVRPVSQFELATRLSYFLWSSMPDEELYRTAAQGKLRNPAVLEAQVHRMLKDPKADALVENFAGQWLLLRNLDVVNPDPEHFDFDDLLRMSMKRETELFLSNIIHEDLSVIDIIGPKYTFLNERLARFYGIPGVTGPEFRKVDLTGNPQRGGLLTQASILTVSSYATRTSPVLRGKWILENILNTPPPPPPPDVPALDVAEVGASVSLREQLEKHRANPACATCHGRMDPLGFGLENYNAIGQWRTMDGKFPIDATGKLPDGRTFEGPEGLKAVILSNRDAFVRALTEKLMTYALGRGLERFDKPVVESIVNRAMAANYRFSSIVVGIVSSMPFEMERFESPKTLEKSKLAQENEVKNVRHS